MTDFKTCVEIILKKEGGYVDDPQDTGGATNMGITIKTLGNWRGHEVTKEDVRALTKKEATEIYKKNYWDAAKCGELPDGVNLMVFDAAVNHGVKRAAILLQQALGMGVEGIDGLVGKKTIEAVKSKYSLIHLINLYSAWRLGFYKSLDNYPHFGKGWEKRLKSVTETALKWVTDK